MTKGDEDLPRQRDFAASKDDLDGMSAWKNFGGLTVSAAHQKFCEIPECYQEDFMWMGGVAFLFYFPVIDRYIRESAVDDDSDGVEAIWILAHAINTQFQIPDHSVIESLRSQVQDLVYYVLGHLPQYDKCPHEQERIGVAWRELQARVAG
jgi:hypothetical protein